MNPRITDPRSDLELVRRFLAGEDAAIDPVSEKLRCVGRFLAAQNRRMGSPLSPEDLEDLRQDTQLVVLRKIDQFAGLAPLEAWIHRICVLEFHNGLRRKRRHGGMLEIQDGDLTTEDVHDRHAERERVLTGLDRLGGVEAELVQLKHFEDLTFEEIGERLGLSPNTVKSRYYRARERFERILRSLEGEAS